MCQEPANNPAEPDNEGAPPPNFSQRLPGVVLASALLAFTFLTALLTARNDSASALILLLTTAFLFLLILKLKVGIRNSLKNLFNENSKPYEFFNKKKSVLQVLYSLTFSLCTATAFMVTIKAATIVYGIIVFFILITIISISLGFFKGKDLITEGMNNQMAHEDNAELATILFRILYSVMTFNVLLALVLSAYDTHLFYSEPFTMRDIGEVASGKGVLANGSNVISKALVNLGIVLETVRSAAINEVLNGLNFERNVSAFFLFFIMMTALNFLKFAPFSIGFVLLYFSFRYNFMGQLQRLTDYCEPYIHELVGHIANIIRQKIRAREEGKKHED